MTSGDFSSRSTGAQEIQTEMHEWVIPLSKRTLACDGGGIDLHICIIIDKII